MTKGMIDEAIVNQAVESANNQLKVKRDFFLLDYPIMKEDASEIPMSLIKEENRIPM